MPEEVSLRPIWSGTITFGLVNVPVNLFPAVQNYGVRLRMLNEEGTPLSRRYYCSADETEVSNEEIVRGFEVEKNEFVVIEDEELEALEPEKSRDIDLRRFVDISELRPYFFERPYFLAPDGKSNKAYRLLAQIMEDEQKAGIATFVMRDKEYLVAILAENRILRAQTLRFADEIRKPEDIGLPEAQMGNEKQISALEKAIKKASKPGLSRDELRDEEAERLIKMVEAKHEKDKDVVRAQPTVEAEEEYVDLMALLKRSISQAA
ncbi:MAG: Ku protein [Acidobacteria bacterium]|nr:MAG: Ku protein [Acidobacteriota bacterium]